MPPRKKSKPRSRVGVPSRIAENEAKPCGVSDCSRPRQQLSKYCNRHTQRRRRLGAPDAATLSRSYYARERSEVTRFLQHFEKHHPAVQAGIEFFRKWMEKAMAGENVPGKRSLVNLARHSTPPRAMLKEVLSTWLYATRRSTAATRAPFLLGNALLKCSSLEKTNEYRSPAGKLVKAYRSPGYHERKEITDTIRKTLTPLMGGMINYLKASETQRNESVKTMSKPLPAGKRKQIISPVYRAKWWQNKQQKIRPKGWKDARTKEGKAERQRIMDLANMFGGGI